MRGRLVVQKIFFSLLLLSAYLFCILIFLGFKPALKHENTFAADQLIRLHVLANSNSPKDQDLKLKVRDLLLEEVKEILGTVEKKEEAGKMLEGSKDSLIRLSEAHLAELGYPYEIDIEIGNFQFPERKYKSFSLAEGNYDAVRVKIGEGLGDNWWCILFPPLCLGELTGDNSDLVLVKKDDLTENRFVFKTKLWEKMTELEYAKQLSKWFKVSAASYNSIQE